MNALIQVVPPGTGGVRDYLDRLGDAWARTGVRSHVIALSQELAAQRNLAERVADCMRDEGAQGATVLLHYSGYGYGRRGLCFWLHAELQRLRGRLGTRLRLIVICHELFASGSPWSSAFWLSSLQALIARRLAREADVVWTNTEQHARWLGQAVGSTVPVHCRPVFSNVGEPAAVPPPWDRTPRGLVFGSASTRQRVFDGLRGRESKLRALGITELVEVGNGAPSTRLPRDLPCRHAGRLDGNELTALLLDSRHGLLDYPPSFLGKSGVFAAYAAHGCIVVNTDDEPAGSDGLRTGEHYLVLDGSVVPPTALQHWYATHPLDRQASELLALSLPVERPAGASPDVSVRVRTSVAN